ncbi:hypothetical protein Pmani_009544 [Petrolisthes manimaculis]|uniref:Uncharacterized protein n=1 Tax=Petrolisthes manimaculis TaxID=1843537 RepID=A0AAE1Q4R0_9EUCA|nr:hypothetical protein Pmani_009544 [Petrolisthes manimaculis]
MGARVREDKDGVKEKDGVKKKECQPSHSQRQGFSRPLPLHPDTPRWPLHSLHSTQYTEQPPPSLPSFTLNYHPHPTLPSSSTPTPSFPLNNYHPHPTLPSTTTLTPSLPSTTTLTPSLPSTTTLTPSLPSSSTPNQTCCVVLCSVVLCRVVPSPPRGLPML